MSNDKSGIVGSFVIVEDGEHYQTGEILAEPTPGFYLVRFDNAVDAHAPMPMMLVSAAEMAEGPHGGIRPWTFFATREDLARWSTWLDTPADPTITVVRSINPRDRH
jgi:hypothetical protein